MFAQYRQDIFVLITIFDAKYVENVRGLNRRNNISSTSAKKVFLEMREFDPFDIGL